MDVDNVDNVVELEEDLLDPRYLIDSYLKQVDQPTLEETMKEFWLKICNKDELMWWQTSCHIMEAWHHKHAKPTHALWHLGHFQPQDLRLELNIDTTHELVLVQLLVPRATRAIAVPMCLEQARQLLQALKKKPAVQATTPDTFQPVQYIGQDSSQDIHFLQLKMTYQQDGPHFGWALPLNLTTAVLDILTQRIEQCISELDDIWDDSDSEGGWQEV